MADVAAALGRDCLAREAAHVQASRSLRLGDREQKCVDMATGATRPNGKWAAPGSSLLPRPGKSANPGAGLPTPVDLSLLMPGLACVMALARAQRSLVDDGGAWEFA